MGRVNMQLINDVKKRRISFLRRKEGLIKKARELSTLCDVNVSMIICSDHQQGPEIFPQDRVKLNNLINAYKSKRISDPRKIKSYDLCDFFKERKNKIEDELAMEFLYDYSQEKLRDFANELGMKIKQVKTKKMSNMQNLGLEGLLKMPLLNPNPITTMTHFDYNNNDNTSIMSDSHVEYSIGSSNTNVDNGFYPICKH
ncbi:transcription factor, MADS-box [Tanacetum coccineum]